MAAPPAANAPTIPNLRKRWGELDNEWTSWRDVYAHRWMTPAACSKPATRWTLIWPT